MILTAIRKRWPWIKHLYVGVYDRGKLMDKAAYLDFVIEVVRRIEDQPGFNVLPRHWVVERTFDWMTRWAAPCPRLRGPHRRVRSHDPCRHWRSSAPTYQPLTFLTGL
jgi:transposase